MKKVIVTIFFLLWVSPVGATVTTFYPDPNVESTSVDGQVGKSGGANQSWGNIRSSVVNRFASDSNAQDFVAYVAATVAEDAWDEFYRGVYLFDTSAIDDGDTVSAGTFSLYIVSKADVFSQSIGLVPSTPAANTSLTAADYNQTGGDTPTRQATDLTIASLTTSAYNDWTLNAAGIASVAITGITKFATRFSGDIDNSAPTWSSGAIANAKSVMADTAGQTSDPKLVITHAVAATPAPKPPDLLWWD